LEFIDGVLSCLKLDMVFYMYPFFFTLSWGVCSMTILWVELVVLPMPMGLFCCCEPNRVIDAFFCMFLFNCDVI